jgi:hypothetical protein
MNKAVKIFLLAILLIFGVTYFYFLTSSVKDNRYERKEKETIQYLRDSLEMEYSKKQLESYPFEHSRIPK